jgi:hypothetical protein
MGKRLRGWNTICDFFSAFKAEGALFSLGVGSANNPISLPNPISATSFTQVVANITQVLLEIAIPLTAIMAIIGGFQMMTAGGDPEKFSKGRKTLMYAAIGFAVVLLAGGLVAIIKNLLTGQ